MEQEEIKLEQEQPQKEPKKHTVVSIILMSAAVFVSIIALIFGLFNELEKLYTCLFACSILLMMLSLNMILKFKGFYIIFYPIILIYSLISSYAFADPDLQFQFSIIATIIYGVYFLQALYEFIKHKNILDFVVSLIVAIASIVLTSLQITFIDLKTLNIILLSIMIAINSFELGKLIFYIKKEEKNKPDGEFEKTEEKER